MKQNILGNFNITRHQMYPKFDASQTLQVLNSEESKTIELLVLSDKRKWQELIQAGNYKLTADPRQYGILYHNLANTLSNHLAETVIPKTPLDFFLFDEFNEKWEKEPSGFIHNDWANYAKCMNEFALPEEAQFYQPTHAIALVLAISLPEVGSGIELYDAFHGEKINARELLAIRQKQQYSLRPYKIGHATLFCPFQFHSGHCAQVGTLKSTDKRIVLVAFLIRFRKNDYSEWHMFRMCKGATLEYGDEALYGLPENVLNDR